MPPTVSCLEGGAREDVWDTGSCSYTTRESCEGLPGHPEVTVNPCRLLPPQTLKSVLVPNRTPVPHRSVGSRF